MKKHLLILLLVPALSFSQNKINANLGATFAGDSHDFGNGGATAALAYFLTDHFTFGVAGDAFCFDNNKAKYGVARLTGTYYFLGKDKSTMFLAVEPGWTLYSKYGITGSYAFDGTIGGKMKFGKSHVPAVYLSMGYGLASFNFSEKNENNSGFKLRLAFGI